MKLNIHKFYIVFKAFSYSNRKSVFNDNSLSIKDLRNKFVRGLDPDMIEGIYPTKVAARKAAEKQYKKLPDNIRKKTKTTKKISKGYALFSDAVMAKDKYRVTTPPKEIYPTRKAAQKAVDRIRKRTGRNPGIKIMTYDSAKR
ncbi:hypothetical protein [Aquimarina algicola]|uniref:Uncharacterized protein n=1 Tax=Aquimarina algicola TaxID=2589995 RepID=A0A504J5N3_9FLAO|nr:hypothetical protein [Aquimarina algicola]TPN82933.1 hypothetical protein FHK87_21135 [Aquimarina algicola]